MEMNLRNWFCREVLIILLATNMSSCVMGKSSENAMAKDIDRTCLYIMFVLLNRCRDISRIPVIPVFKDTYGHVMFVDNYKSSPNMFTGV